MEHFQNKKDVSEKYDVVKNTASTWPDIKKRFCQIWKSQGKNLNERECIYGRYKDVDIAIFQSFLAKKTQNVSTDESLLKKTLNFAKELDKPDFKALGC